MSSPDVSAAAGGNSPVVRSAWSAGQAVDRVIAEPTRRSVESVRRYSFISRYLALFGGESLSKICMVIAFAHLARVLGPKQLGLIELSLSVIVFFVITVEGGLGSYGARLVALNPGAARELVPRVVLLRAIFVIPAYVGVLLVSAMYGLSGLGVLAVYGFTVLLVPFFHQWVFQGLGQMHWVAAGTSLRNLVFAAFVLAVIRHDSDPRLVAIAELLGAAALVIFNAIVLHGWLRLRLNWRGSWAGGAALVAETWSLGASNLTLACLWYAPIVLLGRFSVVEEVAWLAAAVRIVLALNSFVGMYFFNALPNISRELADGVEAWGALIRRSLSTSMWPACFVAVGGVLFAPVAIRILYGSTYGAAILPLQIVIWMIPVGWFGGNFRYSLIAKGDQRFDFRASAITAGITVVLAAIFVQFAASVGAAAALLAGGVANALVAVWTTRRRIGPVEILPSLRPVLLVCLGCIGLGWLGGAVFGKVPGAIIGCLAYVAMALRQDNELVNMVRLRQVWVTR